MRPKFKLLRILAVIGPKRAVDWQLMQPAGECCRFDRILLILKVSSELWPPPCNLDADYSDQKPGNPLWIADWAREAVKMRRGDLMKPDLLSEIVLLGSGALIFIAWLFIVLAALTQQIH